MNLTEQVNAANNAIVSALAGKNITITPSTDAATLQTKLNEITDADTKKEAVTAVVNALAPTGSDNQNLKKAMQNNSDLLAKIGALEAVIDKKTAR